MPIQFPDFQRISFDEANPLLTGMGKGQTFLQNMLQFPQDLQGKILANQIAKVQAQYAQPNAEQELQKAKLYNQYYGRDTESQIGLRSAESKKINYLLDHPGFMGGDEAKTLESLRLMGLLDDKYQPITQQSGNTQIPVQSNKQGQIFPSAIDSVVNQQTGNLNIPTPSVGGLDVPRLVSALLNKPVVDYQYKQALTDSMRQNLSSKPYSLMPARERDYAIAQSRAFGFTGDEASKLLTKGYTVPDLAEMKGYDRNNTSDWPIARGAPTTATQTRMQTANSTLAGLNAVEPIISKAYANYAPRFANISPSLIKDMMQGENIEKQAEAFMAYSLYPELQALRIRAQGGNVGEGAIQHMADASFSRFNTLGLSPNSEVYIKSMHKMNQLINKMNRAENQAIFKQQQQIYDDEDAKSDLNIDMSSISDDDLRRIAGES